MRSTWRFLQLAALLTYAAVELVLKHPRTRQARAAWLHRVCARAIRWFDVRVEVQGSFPGKGALLSNHLSYLDIVIYAALQPCVFVAKAEIEHWPVLGWMTTMAGTVYVKRGKGGSAKEAQADMNAILREELPLVFFPEGTTSSGDGVLPFHSGLLGQLITEQTTITAAFIRYSFLERNVGSTVREDVHYWGDTSLVRHIRHFLLLRGVQGGVTFANKSLRFGTHSMNRKQAASKARAAVCALGNLSEAIPEQ